MARGDGVTAGTVLARFAALLSARSLRDGLMGLFLFYLAWLNVDAFGGFMLAMAAGSIVVKIVDGGLNDLLIKRLAGPGKASLEQAMSANALKLVLLVLALTGLLVFGRAMGYTAGSRRTVFMVALGMGLGSLVDSLYRVLRIEGRQVAESVIRVGAALAGVVLCVLAIQLGSAPWTASLVFVVESLAGLVAVLVLLEATAELPGLLRKVSLRGAAGLVRGAAPFALISVNAIVYNKSNVLFLERYGGAREVAAYSASWLIVDWISVVVSMHLLGGVIYPLMATRYDRDAGPLRELAGRTWMWLLAFAWPICLLLHALRHVLIRVAFPDAYLPAADLQAILLWTIPAAFSTNLFLYLMYSAGRTWQYLGLSLVAQAASLALNLWLVPTGGARGAAWVILGSKGLMALMTLVAGLVIFGTPRVRQVLQILAAGGALWGLWAGASLLLPPEPTAVVLVGIYGLCLARAYSRLHALEGRTVPAASPPILTPGDGIVDADGVCP